MKRNTVVFRIDALGAIARIDATDQPDCLVLRCLQWGETPLSWRCKIMQAIRTYFGFSVLCWKREARGVKRCRVGNMTFVTVPPDPYFDVIGVSPCLQ